MLYSKSLYLRKIAMKKTILLFTLIFFLFLPKFSCIAGENPETQWAIIGAGPAGISVVGLLLDLGVPEKSITWIDPQFNVGRLGQAYGNVPSNTQTRYFVEFIHSCKAFKESNSPLIEKLYTYDPDQEYSLQIIIDPLRDITNHLMQRVNTIKENLQSLDYENDLWHVGTQGKKITAYNVVLATGSHPRTLNYATEATLIPLDTALDKTLLAENVTTHDSIAVVGSAHSAILILKYLSELKVKRILNFYSRPLQYAVPNPTGLINEENGLKGVAARWALEILEKNPPANLIRIANKPEALEAWLPICNKIVYAVGYERNDLPAINGNEKPYSAYDSSSGIIAPRLFGIGIAFPEKIADFEGTEQYGIGLNNFMDYAQRVLPSWMKKKYTQLIQFSELFMITSL